jgi:hypothetical protein
VNDCGVGVGVGLGVGVGVGAGVGLREGVGLGLGALGVACAAWVVVGALEDAPADGVGVAELRRPEDDVVGLGLADGAGLARFFLAVGRCADADLDAFR